MEYEKVKAILDRECYEKWHAKRCQRHGDNMKFTRTPCWLCDRNIELAREILDAVGGEK